MGDDDEGAASVLRRAIAKQEAVLRSMQSVHGEFHLSVSDDLAQLALLYNMSGEFDKALPLLHKRLVIHEKFGPDELTGETLQDLGTVYRLHGVLEVAQQHLERALAIRERCHGRDSLKVAETLNSLALVHAERSDAAQAEAFQLRSLQVLFESAEPEDIESEDVPWEVYKRLKQQRGPSTASNSVTLFKGNMRKRVVEAALAAQLQMQSLQSPLLQIAANDNAGSPMFDFPLERRGQNSGPTSPAVRSDLSMRRATRSHSDSGAMKKFAAESAAAAVMRDESEFAERQPLHPNGGGAPPQGLRIHIQTTESSSHAGAGLHRHVSSPVAQPLGSPVGVFQRRVAPTAAAPIGDLQALQHRVELVKRCIAAGFAESDDEIARLVADVDAIAAPALRDVGFTMLSLVREMNRLRVTSDSARYLPVLEGMLEKKSASIFRGWERRWFKVDAKTFILSYHFSKDDHARGFAPRGGFPLSRVANIIVHRHARGGHFHFDIVVDLSTRLNPHAARTYELRCEDQDTLRYWVETLHYYKATAQTTPARPSTS